MAELLCSRRLVRRYPDRFTVRRAEPHHQQADSTADAEAGGALATPTIVHFGAVLGLSGILGAPWDPVGTAAVVWGLVGVCGVMYVVIVTRRMRAQTAYEPELEDWLFHVLLPVVAYVTLAVAACAALAHLRESLFAVGAAVLLLLLVGIHNVWDAVTYHMFLRK